MFLMVEVKVLLSAFFHFRILALFLLQAKSVSKEKKIWKQDAT